jgi:hypothetical protein
MPADDSVLGYRLGRWHRAAQPAPAIAEPPTDDLADQPAAPASGSGGRLLPTHSPGDGNGNVENLLDSGHRPRMRAAALDYGFVGGSGTPASSSRATSATFLLEDRAAARNRS